MIEDQPIDYEVEYNKVSNELAELRQKYSELEQDWEYIRSLLDAEFEKNVQLKSENKRLTDKLNKTALELVDGVISQGKASEISEMSYSEFLDYRAKNGKPMELQL